MSTINEIISKRGGICFEATHIYIYLFETYGEEIADKFKDDIIKKDTQLSQPLEALLDSCLNLRAEGQDTTKILTHLKKDTDTIVSAWLKEKDFDASKKIFHETNGTWTIMWSDFHVIAVHKNPTSPDQNFIIDTNKDFRVPIDNNYASIHERLALIKSDESNMIPLPVATTTLFRGNRKKKEIYVKKKEIYVKKKEIYVVSPLPQKYLNHYRPENLRITHYNYAYNRVLDLATSHVKQSLTNELITVMVGGFDHHSGSNPSQNLLHSLCQAGFEKIIQSFCLHKGIDSKIKSLLKHKSQPPGPAFVNKQLTPLQCAMWFGHTEVIKTLKDIFSILNMKDDFDQQISEGRNLLDTTQFGAHIELKSLIDSLNPDTRSPFYHSDSDSGYDYAPDSDSDYDSDSGSGDILLAGKLVEKELPFLKQHIIQKRKGQKGQCLIM